MDSKTTTPIEYTELLKKFRQRNNEPEIVRRIMKQLAMEMDVFKTFKTCLSIGTGYGDYDIDFVKTCLPNLKKLIVVEMNPDCVKELKINLKAAFGDQLNVEIHETSIENFMKYYKESNIDIALAFHVFYFLESDAIKSLLKMCFNAWLQNENGLLVFVLNSQNDDLEAIALQINPNVKPIQHFKELTDKVKEFGLSLKKISFRITVDLREFGEDIYSVICSNCKLQVSQDVMKEAIKKVVPTGWSSWASEFCMIAKHDF